MLQILLLDCSGSMQRQGRLALAKGVLQVWLQQAAASGQRVAVIGFGGDQVRRWFGPARPGPGTADWIHAIGGGGGSNLEQGLQAVAQLRRRHRGGPPPRLWLLTDGRCPEHCPRPAGLALSVLDFGHSGFTASAAARLAQRWQADYLDLPALGLQLQSGRGAG